MELKKIYFYLSHCICCFALLGLCYHFDPEKEVSKFSKETLPMREIHLIKQIENHNGGAFIALDDGSKWRLASANSRKKSILSLAQESVEKKIWVVIEIKGENSVSDIYFPEKTSVASVMLEPNGDLGVAINVRAAPYYLRRKNHDFSRIRSLLETVEMTTKEICFCTVPGTTDFADVKECEEGGS